VTWLNGIHHGVSSKHTSPSSRSASIAASTHLMPSGRSLGWPGVRPRRPGRDYIRESGSILHVVGMGVKRIGTVGLSPWASTTSPIMNGVTHIPIGTRSMRAPAILQDTEKVSLGLRDQADRSADGGKALLGVVQNGDDRTVPHRSGANFRQRKRSTGHHLAAFRSQLRQPPKQLSSPIPTIQTARKRSNAVRNWTGGSASQR